MGWFTAALVAVFGSVMCIGGALSLAGVLDWQIESILWWNDSHPMLGWRFFTASAVQVIFVLAAIASLWFRKAYLALAAAVTLVVMWALCVTIGELVGLLPAQSVVTPRDAYNAATGLPLLCGIAASWWHLGRYDDPPLPFDRCWICGYDLAGLPNTTLQCPECGSGIRASA